MTVFDVSELAEDDDLIAFWQELQNVQQNIIRISKWQSASLMRRANELLS